MWKPEKDNFDDTDEYVKVSENIIKKHYNSKLVKKYPDLKIVEDMKFLFYMDLLVFIGVTDNEVTSDLEIFGKTAIVVLPAYVYSDMLSYRDLMTLFKTAFQDRLNDISFPVWYGECGISRFMIAKDKGYEKEQTV